MHLSIAETDSETDLGSVFHSRLTWHLAVIGNLNRPTQEEILEKCMVLWEILAIFSQQRHLLPFPASEHLNVHLAATS
jgi:hypothetical protein